MLAVDSHSHLHPGKTWCFKNKKQSDSKINFCHFGSGSGRNHRDAGLYNKKSLILVFRNLLAASNCASFPSHWPVLLFLIGPRHDGSVSARG